VTCDHTDDHRNGGGAGRAPARRHDNSKLMRQ
jgi:hypothetical protein